jgi:hypothetical protein
MHISAVTQRPAAAAAARNQIDYQTRPPPHATRAPQRTRNDNRGLLTGLGLAIALTFALGRTGYYTPGDNVGYYLGLVGGIMMLILLVYPMRKHFRFMRSWGATKYWFAGHMFFGIGGPLLVLAHSTFHIGSTNALVALTSMLLVAGSGVVGRFIYVRIHHGLYGERTTLKELQMQTGLSAEQVHSNLSFLPLVEQRLRAFEASAMPEFESLAHDALRFVTLGVRRQLVYARCMLALRQALRVRARERGWDQAKYRRRFKAMRVLVRDYLATVQRVSQFSVYEKVFALWHVLHVPLVYLLVFSAIAHVVAVHMY